MTVQNFSVPAGDTYEETVDLSPFNLMLVDAVAYWRVFSAPFAVPDPTVPPLIEKSSLSGGDVELIESPPAMIITLVEHDTISLLRNYYREGRVIDANGNVTTVVTGVMTVTGTETR
jgi:hypothetical protein